MEREEAFRKSEQKHKELKREKERLHKKLKEIEERSDSHGQERDNLQKQIAAMKRESQMGYEVMDQ